MDLQLDLIQYLTSQHTDERLCRVIENLCLAARHLNDQLSKGGQIGTGKSAVINIQGELQHHMDDMANRIFRNALPGLIYLSEEEPEPVYPTAQEADNRMVVAVDPLDGSSNIELNQPLGSIFSVYQTGNASLLQAGAQQLAAGYFLYGLQTVLVLTCGERVSMFTLNRHKGMFLLERENIRLPESGRYYALNEGLASSFSEPMRIALSVLKKRGAGELLSLRYSGCLVADVHRILLKGGIFLYPATEFNPRGKLRLLYECSPLAWIITVAGGQATDGQTAILSLVPFSVHERCPLILGSKQWVEAMASTDLQILEKHENF